MTTSMNAEIGLAGYYDIWLRAPNGRRFRPTSCPGTIKNVITDLGLDSCFARSFCASRQYLAMGTGSTAATTSDTGLATYYATSQTHSTTENGRTVSFADRYVEDYMTHTWTNSTGSDKTLYEFGTTWLTTANPAVFSRIVISAGVTIPNGYELIVRYTLRKYIPNWRSPATGTVTIGGTSVGCTYMAINDNTAASDTTGLHFFYYFRADGYIAKESYIPLLLEPYTTGDSGYDRVALFQSSTAYATLSATENLTTPTLYSYGGTVLSTYVAGSFTRTKYYVFLASTLPETTIYGFTVGTNEYRGQFICRFDSGQVKLATRKWTCGVTLSLSRV